MIIFVNVFHIITNFQSDYLPFSVNGCLLLTISQKRTGFQWDY